MMWVSWVGAAAFAIGAAWYGLATRGITMAAQPSFAPGESIEQATDAFLRWFATTLTQERFYTSFGIVGFASLAIVAIAVRDRLSEIHGPAQVEAAAVVAGAGLWIVADVARLGAHAAVGAMATHENPRDVVNAILFTVDKTSDTMQTAAFVLLGLGAVALVRASATGAPFGAAWRWLTATIGVLCLAVAVLNVTDHGDVSDVLLLGLGVALLPIWLVRTTLQLERQSLAK